MKVDSLIENSSKVEKIQMKVPPDTMPSIHPESGHSAHPSWIISTIESSNAGYPCAQDNKTTELLRLKQELLAANSKIALQEQELAHTRVIKHTLDQALGPPSEADFGGREITEQTIAHLQSAFNASNHPFGQFQDAWNAQDDSQSDISDALSAGAYNRARGLWNQHDHLSFGMNTIEPSFDKQYDESAQRSNPMTHDPSRLWGGSTHPAFATHGPLQSHRCFQDPRPVHMDSILDLQMNKLDFFKTAPLEPVDRPRNRNGEELLYHLQAPCGVALHRDLLVKQLPNPLLCRQPDPRVLYRQLDSIPCLRFALDLLQRHSLQLPRSLQRLPQMEPHGQLPWYVPY